MHIIHVLTGTVVDEYFFPEFMCIYKTTIETHQSLEEKTEKHNTNTIVQHSMLPYI